MIRKLTLPVAACTFLACGAPSWATDHYVRYLCKFEKICSSGTPCETRKDQFGNFSIVEGPDEAWEWVSHGDAVWGIAADVEATDDTISDVFFRHTDGTRMWSGAKEGRYMMIVLDPNGSALRMEMYHSSRSTITYHGACIEAEN